MKIADKIHGLFVLSVLVAPIIHVLNKHDWSIDWLLSAF